MASYAKLLVLAGFLLHLLVTNAAEVPTAGVNSSEEAQHEPHLRELLYKELSANCPQILNFQGRQNQDEMDDNLVYRLAPDASSIERGLADVPVSFRSLPEFRTGKSGTPQCMTSHNEEEAASTRECVSQVDMDGQRWIFLLLGECSGFQVFRRVTVGIWED